MLQVFGLETFKSFKILQYIRQFAGNMDFLLKLKRILNDIRSDE